MENSNGTATAKATVKSCTHLKFWEKDGKKIPIFTVTFSDGVTGESFGSEIPVGTPASDCTITDGQYGKKIKFNKKGGFGGGGKGFSPKNYKADFISFAMSYTKDLCVAGKIDLKDLRKTFNTMYSVMEEKLNEVNGTQNK